MNRTDVLRHIASLRNGAPMIISPGLANYPIAEAKDEPLTIYNMDMPYTTSMALGMALGWPERKVISIEGDGSLLAGPGALSTVARYQPKNLLIFVFDNGAYLTTGSGNAPTATVFGTDIEQLGRAAGLQHTRTVHDLDAAKDAISAAFTEQISIKALLLLISRIISEPSVMPSSVSDRSIHTLTPDSSKWPAISRTRLRSLLE